MKQIGKKPICDGGRLVRVNCPSLSLNISETKHVVETFTTDITVTSKVLVDEPKKYILPYPLINFTIYLDSTPIAFPTTKKVAVSSSATPKSDNNIFTELKEQVEENLIKIISYNIISKT